MVGSAEKDDLAPPQGGQDQTGTSITGIPKGLCFGVHADPTQESPSREYPRHELWCLCRPNLQSLTANKIHEWSVAKLPGKWSCCLWLKMLPCLRLARKSLPKQSCEYIMANTGSTRKCGQDWAGKPKQVTENEIHYLLAEKMLQLIWNFPTRECSFGYLQFVRSLATKNKKSRYCRGYGEDC